MNPPPCEILQGGDANTLVQWSPQSSESASSGATLVFGVPQDVSRFLKRVTLDDWLAAHPQHKMVRKAVSYHGKKCPIYCGVCDKIIEGQGKGYKNGPGQAEQHIKNLKHRSIDLRLCSAPVVREAPTDPSASQVGYLYTYVHTYIHMYI